MESKMNERIRELRCKAQELAAEAFPGKVPFDPNPDPILWDRIHLSYEKFAELIVQECVNAVMDGTKEGDHYAQRIEQHFDNGQGGILHFGVEE
jgi:hypothetical protein